MKPRLVLPAAVSEKVRRVAVDESARLEAEGIKHLLIGGLAVGALGYDRATRDVDFLLDIEARRLVSGRLLTGGVSGVTSKVRGVPVDFVFQEEGETFLDEVLLTPPERTVEDVPVVPMPTLVLLKLKRGWRKDQRDIIELVKLGRLKPTPVRAYLDQHRPDFVEEFDGLVSEAIAEEKAGE